MAGTCGILSTVTLVLSTCGNTRVDRILCFLWVSALFPIMECELLSHTGSQIHLSNLYWIMIKLRYTHKINIRTLLFN